MHTSSGGIRQISLGDPILGQGESDALRAVIESGWVTMGERVQEFEQRFAQLHRQTDGVAVSSATAGLHLVLEALGVGPGDEVLVPSLTFVATTNAVLYTGATPKFVDIESLESPMIDLEDAARKLTPRTKAVMVVNYAGYAPDWQRWREFCDAHKLAFVEDAAHSPGLAGSSRWADAAVYSFFSNKNMTTAEGGMILSRHEKVLSDCRLLRAHGMTASTLDRHKGHVSGYDVICLGYNYRLDELRAAIGLTQLERLPKWNQIRNRLSRRYRDLLPERLRVPFSSEIPHTAHLLPVVLPPQTDRAQIMQAMREAGIQTSVHYTPIHRFTLYRERFPGLSLPVSEEYGSRTMSLPLHAGLTEDQVDFIVSTLTRCV